MARKIKFKKKTTRKAAHFPSPASRKNTRNNFKKKKKNTSKSRKLWIRGSSHEWKTAKAQPDARCYRYLQHFIRCTRQQWCTSHSGSSPYLCIERRILNWAFLHSTRKSSTTGRHFPFSSFDKTLKIIANVFTWHCHKEVSLDCFIPHKVFETEGKVGAERRRDAAWWPEPMNWPNAKVGVWRCGTSIERFVLKKNAAFLRFRNVSASRAQEDLRRPLSKYEKKTHSAPSLIPQVPLFIVFLACICVNRPVEREQCSLFGESWSIEWKLLEAPARCSLTRSAGRKRGGKQRHNKSGRTKGGDSPAGDCPSTPERTRQSVGFCGGCVLLQPVYLFSPLSFLSSGATPTVSCLASAFALPQPARTGCDLSDWALPTPHTRRLVLSCLFTRSTFAHWRIFTTCGACDHVTLLPPLDRCVLRVTRRWRR